MHLRSITAVKDRTKVKQISNEISAVIIDEKITRNIPKITITKEVWKIRTQVFKCRCASSNRCMDYAGLYCFFSYSEARCACSVELRGDLGLISMSSMLLA